jgi:two-component sensor histidine kinase
MLLFVWQKDGARPTMAGAPEEPGFGTRPLAAFAKQLGAEMPRQSEDGDLVITLRIPLGTLAQASPAGGTFE